MRVIGAGLPRTATLSQKVGLEMLGLGPCYHMVNVLGDLSLVDVWRRRLEGEVTWEEIFAGHVATVDWPGAFFYAELAEAYPDARVLLSVRDPEAWEQSMRKTIWGAVYGDILIHDLATAWGRVDPRWRNYTELMTEMWQRSGLLDGDHSRPGALAAAMERYNQTVQETVPAERLLVWSATDGWEPLCEFLEVSVPTVPFPHLNDAKAFTDRVIDGALLALEQWRTEENQAEVAPAG